MFKLVKFYTYSIILSIRTSRFAREPYCFAYALPFRTAASPCKRRNKKAALGLDEPGAAFENGIIIIPNLYRLRDQNPQINAQRSQLPLMTDC